MTDKHIAAELGRTVTQVRWKMKDLELTGVRDLSKLAKVASSRVSSTTPQVRQTAPTHPAKPKPLPTVELKPKASRSPSPSVDLYTPFELALKRLESQLTARLKDAIAEAEAGMVRAAKAAIAEKARIDQRLAKLGERLAKAEVKAEATRKAEKVVPPARAKEPRPLPRKPVAKTVLPAVQTSSRQASPPPPAPPLAPKIVVVDAPVAARPPLPDPAPTQLSGRGGWKSVRRDPARVAAQARAKTTKRADAVDLAQAAQTAIERFIAERGVTRTTTDASQALVSRLQARGYIVVREEDGWVIDQRHRIASETDLVAFADARGISLEIAA
ncbi:hypothetical protein [Microvirga sp. 2TAF3]|uniref:hypothetical protein n=1 Tax=Microvirga sp. 2TAF3 TaxID=3233014 RepID=UPI003F957DF1